jgi:hypothetical protein
MANTKAYTVLLGPQLSNGSAFSDEGGSTLGPTIGLIGQTSPTWVLTFVRWQYRDTLRTPTTDPNVVRPTLVVENDCLQVTVSHNKANLTPSMTAILVETDVNYSASVHPGDFVFVNMLNWESDARAVAQAATNGLPINGAKQGFKGFYKVQSVRKIVQSDPATGIKTTLIKIDGFAFTEFNNTIYFNPNLIQPKNLQNQALFINDVANVWKSFISSSGIPNIQDILAFLIQSLIGSGVNPKAQKIDGLVVSPNVHFLVPVLVGSLLGIGNSILSAKDIYEYVFGIQQYSNAPAQTLEDGLNPFNLQDTPKYPNFYYTDDAVPGSTLLKPEYWNQVKLWSILNQYINAPLNELYTSFKISPNGNVMPTVVFRQIPFTSEDFTGQKFGVLDGNAQSIHVTRFLTLPRWKIGSESVFNVNIGTDEAARINFVQFYAKSNFTKNGMELSLETAKRNYVYDQRDIVRSGLRPYIVQNQMDDLPDNTVYHSPIWSRILGDAVIGGHLKLNGTIECIGIVEPIPVGDNFEFDGVVYHVEQVVHSCAMNPTSGIKTFRTVLSLSHGVSVNSSAQGMLYSQMTHTSGLGDRTNDYSNEQILPGVSESQDVISRPTNLDTPVSIDHPFPQPKTSNSGTPNVGE